jgi:hypothetical protein
MAPRNLNISVARDVWPISRLYRPGKESIEEKDERTPRAGLDSFQKTKSLASRGRQTRFLGQTARNLVNIPTVTP